MHAIVETLLLQDTMCITDFLLRIRLAKHRGGPETGRLATGWPK